MNWQEACKISEVDAAIRIKGNLTFLMENNAECRIYNKKSPIARFVPTYGGWLMAREMCTCLSKIAMH